MSALGPKRTNRRGLKPTVVRYAPNSGHCPPPDTKEKPDGGQGAPREGDQTPRGIPPATGREIETARAVGVVFSLHFPTCSASRQKSHARRRAAEPHTSAPISIQFVGSGASAS